MEKKTTQEKFDELVAEDGAEAVVSAIKGHIHPDGATCDPQHPCPKGYYCSGGDCILDVG